jgi:hypothetical protein
MKELLMSSLSRRETLQWLALGAMGANVGSLLFSAVGIAAGWHWRNADVLCATGSGQCEVREDYPTRLGRKGYFGRTLCLQ